MAIALDVDQVGVQLLRKADCVTGSGEEGALITIGIDPGLTGAVSVIYKDGISDGWAGVFDLPVQRDKSLAWIDGLQLARILSPHLTGEPSRAVAIVERVSAMPKQGVASSFGFGVNFGSVLGVLQALRVPIELVTPAKWKREMGLGAEKHASLHKARMLFPRCDLTLKKHDGRAEALLLAHWHICREKRGSNILLNEHVGGTGP